MKPGVRSEVLFWGVCLGAVCVWMGVFLFVNSMVKSVLATVGPQGFPYFPFHGFLGGNPDEVRSHYCGFLNCSGVFAVLMAVGWAERRLLAWGVGDFPVRTAAVSAGFAPLAWLIAIKTLDGEGVGLIAIIYCYGFLILLSLGGCHRLLSRLPSSQWDGFWTLVSMVGFFVCQLVYEPSDTGGPNGLVLAFLGLAVLFYSWAGSRNRKEARPGSENLIGEKG